MITLSAPIDLKPYEDGYQLVLIVGEAFDYDTPFRTILVEIAATGGFELSLPAWSSGEDFIEGQLTRGDLHYGVYFEHALGYLSLGSASRAELQDLADILEPMVVVAEPPGPSTEGTGLSHRLKVMLVAAEPSGDALGAGLARALRAKLGEGVAFVGVGGPRMAAEGIASPFDVSDLAVLGYLEGVAAYPRVVRRADETAALAAREKPDVAVLIDSWGFTLRVARRLRRLDPQLPLVKYVGPQVWASRPGRARTLAATVDRLLTIHAFDAPLFEAVGLPTTVVGNPTLSKSFAAADGTRLRAKLGIAADAPLLLVLPGSRPGEVARLMPPFEDAAARLKASHPALHVAVVVAPSVAEAVRLRVAGWLFAASLVEGDADRDDAMVAADVALACSGTVTTELALAGCPMVVGYRLAPLTHWIASRIILTPWITLFNVAAKAFVAPEFVQDRCTGGALAAAVARVLDDPAARTAQAAAQTASLDLMGRGGGDPFARAADAVLEVLAARRPGLISAAQGRGLALTRRAGNGDLGA